MVTTTSSETPPVVGHEFKPALVLVRPGLCELHCKNAPGLNTGNQRRSLSDPRQGTVTGLGSSNECASLRSSPSPGSQDGSTMTTEDAFSNWDN